MANREKIEFWLSSIDKLQLVELCKKGGYTVAEVMRRAVEDQLRNLETRLRDKEVRDASRL